MPDLLPFRLEPFVQALKVVFEILRSLPGVLEDDRTGVAYTLGEQLEVPDGQDPSLHMLAHGVVGSCSPAKELFYRFFSLRKIMALLYHTEHLTSQESADPDAASKPIPDRSWGGGIRIWFEGHNMLFSVSGLPWKCDEAICVVTIWVLSWITTDQAYEYAHRSTNPFTTQLLQAAKSHGYGPTA
jgi:hypothetical protein